jgi:uncharacterized membrane protein YphA (DoxX/SURF4 family)
MDISEVETLFEYLAVYARWITGGVLLIAGVAKARAMSEFVATIQLFRIVPRQPSKMVARLIVGLEVIVGTCLLAGISVQLAVVVAVVLFSVFVLVILINLVRHNIFDCNCFGPYFKQKIGIRVLIRNLLLITLCIWTLKFYNGYLALESWLPDRMTTQNRSFGPFFLLTAVVIFSWLSVLSIKTILKNFNLTDTKR